jgi:DegV family protein with EDD domain
MTGSTAIVTDSTSDIPAELGAELGIEVIPAILVIDGKSYQDGENLTREEFYSRLPNMKSTPTTAAPSSAAFQKCYERIFRAGYRNILSIHVASKLSGICNAAHIAAQSFRNQVRVIDSEQVTLGLGFQVLCAAEAARKNLSITKIMEVIESTRQRIRLVAMLDTLEYIRRSGRVSWARASLGTLFQIKPFVGLSNGEVFRLGDARTRRKGIERLLEMLMSLGPLERLAILHTNAEPEARDLLQVAASSASSTPLLVNVTSIIGTHVGPSGLGYVAVVQ